MPYPYKDRSPAPTPPALTKNDRKHLRLYLEDLAEDPHALARATGSDYLNVLAWLDSPPIRHALKLHDEFQKRAAAAAMRQAQAAAAPLRAACIDALSEALRRSLQDPRSQTSLRLAAGALLRALAKPLPPPLSASPPASTSALPAAPLASPQPAAPPSPPFSLPSPSPEAAEAEAAPPPPFAQSSLQPSLPPDPAPTQHPSLPTSPTTPTHTLLARVGRALPQSPLSRAG